MEVCRRDNQLIGWEGPLSMHNDPNDTVPPGDMYRCGRCTQGRSTGVVDVFPVFVVLLLGRPNDRNRGGLDWSGRFGVKCSSTRMILHWRMLKIWPELDNGINNTSELVYILIQLLTA